MSGLTPDEVIELKHGMAGVAELTRAFYVQLQAQGFTDTEALRLTSVWLEASVRGPQGGAE